MRGCRLFVVLVAMFAAARTASAQAVSGIVVLPDGVTPAGGVIVTATDSRAFEVSRGLTNARGEYTLRLPAAGRVLLKALRIGFRPTNGPTVDAAPTGKTDAPRIVLIAEAVSLTAVNVRDRETCRVNADTGLMVTRVWEEARKAMLSTQLEAGAPLFAEWIEYDQTLDSSARVVRAQRVRTSRNPTTHAFRSRPVAFLDTAGYIVVENGEATYFAPDAEVLLSELFAAHHCFRLASPPREAPELIGVAFQPTRDRREARDIQGTLWLDRRTNELRTLEFQYTNLNDVATAAGAGGRVEFLRLGEGSWLISRWSLRMPQLEARRTGGRVGRVTVSSTQPVLRAIQMTGGEVTRVLRSDAEIYRAIGPRVAVQVVGTDSLVRAAGATVTLDGTDYRGVADATGRIAITPVLAGRYRARLQTPLMDSLGMPPIMAEVAARTDERMDSIRLPSPRDVLSRTCPKDSIANGEGMIYGRVLDGRAMPVPQAGVVVTWLTNVDIIGAAKGDQLRHTQVSLSAVTGTDGSWRICGVPRERSMVVHVISDSGRVVRPMTLVSDFAPVALVVGKNSTTAGREVGIAAGRGELATAMVEFTVLSSTGVPLPGVSLEVKAGGVTRSISTGPSGKAIVPDLPPGVITVRARRIGFTQGEIAARVAAGRNTVPIRLSERAMPRLDTVRVVGDRVELARHDEFETRRLRKEATVSFTYEEIRKRNAPHLWQMLMGVPSLRVIDTDTGVFVVSSRVVVKSIQDQGYCYAVVMVDGLIKNSDPSKTGFDMRDLPASEEVHGIEVFAGAATIPLKYGGTGQGKWCAMIAIWTR
jgi:hypothetical protein